MTRKQIDTAISTLMDQAAKHVQSAGSCGKHSEPAWTAYMAAGMVCSSLIEVLVAVRKAQAQEDRGYDTDQTGLQQL